MHKQMLFINKVSSSDLESECAFILALLPIYVDPFVNFVPWYFVIDILLFVFVSRVILHGVLLTWYSYLFWLILTPCQLLFSSRIHIVNPAILMSLLWIIIISYKPDSHGWTSLDSILWGKYNCDMLIIHLLPRGFMGHILKQFSLYNTWKKKQC